MASKKRFAFNVGMNWIAMAVGLVVPFFLTPFVLRSLGPVAYGIWILAVSTVAYLGLLDLGLRSAVIRFVSRAQAQGKIDDAQSTIGAALWFRLLISAGVVVLSVALSLAFPHMFKIPHDLARAGQITVLLCALGVAVTLVTGVFNGVLAATNRFDVLSMISMGQTLARAGGVILILRSGRGLISLAYWEFTVISLAGLATVGAAFKIFPPCKVRVARPQIQTLKLIWSHSLITFVWMIAIQVILNTDNLVIGAFLSVGIVAYYSIGGSLVSYSGQVVSALSTTFTPLASSLEASNKLEDLRRLLLRGTQATLGIMLPISLTLLFRGKTFISLWMGHEYSEIAGTVLQILMIAQFFTVAGATAGAIMMAIGKHKPVAIWSILEAALNLALSLLLVKKIGIYGVAWGTSIASALVSIVFWPRYLRRILDVPIRIFLWEGWARISICSIPFAIACIAADKYWPAASLVIFFSQVLATLPVYGICVLVIFRSEARNLFRRWQESRLDRAQAAL